MIPGTQLRGEGRGGEKGRGREEREGTGRGRGRQREGRGVAWRGSMRHGRIGRPWKQRNI